MLTRVTFICLLIIFCYLRESYAAGTVEVRQARGLVLLEGAIQWVGLRYQFSDHDADSSNSNYSSHTFDEVYHISTAFSLLDPHLLRVTLDGEVWLEQLENSSDASGSSSGNSTRYQYSLTASALDRSWHPVLVYSSLSHDSVVAPFSPTYDTETGRHGIELSLLKETSRVKLRFERNSLDITGGATSSNTTSDTFQGSGSHNYRGIMSNSLDLSLGYQRSSSQGISQTGNNYAANYNNYLNLGKQKNYTLSSQLQYNKETFGGLPQESLLWSEDLVGRLGKALEAELTYRYNQISTTVVEGQKQDYSINTATGMLRHRLFQSLETRLRGNYSQSELLGGSESHYAGAIDLTYRKKLPARSQLTVGVSGEHGITDRQLDADQLSVTNRRFVITQPFDVIDLRPTGLLVSGSVRVRGFSVPPPNLQFPTDITYVEGIDYTVDYTLGQIVWGGSVPSVPNIVVSYSVLFDPSVKYATDIITLSSSLSLLDNRYQVNGYLLKQNYNIISGSALGLYDTRIARLQFQAFLEKQRYTLTLSDYAAGPTKYRFVEGLWQYNTVDPFSITLLVRDRYTMYDDTATIPGYGNNSLSASAACSRPVFGRALATLSLNVLDIRDDRMGTSDSIFLRGSLRSRFNKLTVELVGSTGWRINEKFTVRDDYVRLEVRRFF